MVYKSPKGLLRDQLSLGSPEADPGNGRQYRVLSGEANGMTIGSGVIATGQGSAGKRPKKKRLE